MDPVTRRSFFVKGSAAAAGVAGATAIAGFPRVSAASLEPDLDDDEINNAEPVMLDITDVATGELELLVGEKSITFIDKNLVARIVRASR